MLENKSIYSSFYQFCCHERKGKNQYPEHARKAEANFRYDHGQKNQHLIHYLKGKCTNNRIKLEHTETLLGAIVACGRHGGMGYGTGLCGLYVDGAYINKKKMEKAIVKALPNVFQTKN